MEKADSGMIKLKTSNYSIWKTRMKNVLYCKELFESIECMIYKSVTTTEDEWNKLNRKTIGQIRQWADQSIFHHVAKEVHAYSLWQKLESLWEKYYTEQSIYDKKASEFKVQGW